MYGGSSDLYYCSKCNYLEVKNNSTFENNYCPMCKSSDTISLMSRIQEEDILKHECHKCSKPQLEVFDAGVWD